MSAEDDFIARHFASMAGPGALGLRDDAALVTLPPGRELVVTTDALVAGVHFFPNDPPGDIARKALRVNLSDLAAKGADPLGFLLTLALPDGRIDEVWWSAFAAALREDVNAYKCSLLGGDTVSTPGPLTISIAALGSVPCGQMVRRGTAKSHDRLYVTGTIGDAALGLLVARDDAQIAALSALDRAFLLHRYRTPQPRCVFAEILRTHASAAMDISDGLAGDLTKMLVLAELSIEVDVSKLPFSDATKRAFELDSSLEALAITGGDDYEIVFTVQEDQCRALEAAARNIACPVTFIGTIKAGQPLGASYKSRNGRALPLDRLSYSHISTDRDLSR